jgi:hypothetical protein
MPVYETQTIHCGKCNDRLIFDEVFEDKFIGRPYTICLKCKSVNRHPSRSEWRLKKKKALTKYYLYHAYHVFTLGPIGGFVAALALHSFLDIPLHLACWILIPIGILSAAAAYFIIERKKVLESNTRMKESEYLLSLEELGIIRRKKKPEIHGRN